MNKRYFVDIRSGCGAVRDREHPNYDANYPGLHQDTSDVIEYRHGYTHGGIWVMRESDIEFLNKKCDELNGK